MRSAIALAASALCTQGAVLTHGAPLELHVGACAQCKHSTLHGARDAVRSHRATRGLEASNENVATIVVHEGTYEPLVLDRPQLDSFVTYRGFNALGEGPAVVSAGTPIPKAAWAPAGASMPAGTLVANISALGLSPGGALPEQGTTCCDGCDQSTQLTAQLFHSLPDVAFQPKLARYPNANGNDWQFMFSLGQATAADGKTPVGLEVAETDAARVTRWMQEEEAPYVHGYYEQDWADGIMHVRSAAHAFPGKPTQEILKRSGDNSTVLYWADGVTQASKPHARFFGLNLLSELDSAGEYHLSRTSGLLHYLPALPLEQWDNTTGIPVWSVNETAVFFAPGTASVSLSGVTVAHATNLGVSGSGTTNVDISNVTVVAHGAGGIFLDGTGHTVRDSTVTDVGCRGIQVHCGDLVSLSPGGCSVTGNFVTRMAQYKRTYQPGIHWGGVENNYTHNTVVDGPHNCFLGGGNEVGSAGGVGNLFEYNTLDNCAFEASDTGAFYSCGQGATAFVNPGNVVRHSTFSNIRSTSEPGVQAITIQAIYLDDQMSSWEIYNNSFINCTTGTFVGGGRLNNIHHNYYQDVGTVHHFDNRGMGWQKGVDVGCVPPSGAGTPCVPNGGCMCDVLGFDYVLAGAAGAEWRSRFPQLVSSHNDSKCMNSKDGGIPCYNIFSDNTYCRATTVIDASAASIASWNSVAANNTEVTC